MKYIALTKGYSAIVDDSDVPLISKHSWRVQVRKDGLCYAITSIWKPTSKTYTCIAIHRLIMGFPTSGEIDHINHNGLDNRRENLRIVTHSENLKNRRPYSARIFFKKHGHNRVQKVTPVTGVHL